MYNFILQIVLMVGLGTMIYLVGRAVPRIGDELSEPTTGRLDRWISSLPLQQIDAAWNGFLEKFLRRARLVLMKLDNSVSGYLHRVKKLNGNGGKNGQEKPTLFTNGSNGSAGSKEENSEGDAMGR